MTSTFRWSDLLTGLIAIGIGIAATVAGLSYGVGSIARMGPGFMPACVGVLVTFSGVLLVVDSRQHSAEQPLPANLRALFFFIAGIGAFALLIESAGLVPAIFATVIFCSRADRSTTFMQALYVSFGLSLVAIVVFVYVLGFQAAPFGSY